MIKNFRYTILLFFLMIFLSESVCYSQNNKSFDYFPDSLNKKRLTGVIITESVIYAGSMIGLNSLWYKGYPRSSFHFINDNKGWLQMDKLGHSLSSYFIGRIGHKMLRWSGVDEKKAIWYGGMLGFAYLLNVEILDGFSKEWGASASDLLANGIGSGLYIGQQLCWGEQRFLLKYSFHQTKFPDYTNDQLGDNLIQEIIKDYNGGTVWLSTNISSFMKNRGIIPEWLNVAIGYSPEGLIGANSNPTELNGAPIPHFDRYRQYYFSLDVDFNKIKTNSKTLKLFFEVLNIVKIPFPALEYNKFDGLKFHYLYF